MTDPHAGRPPADPVPPAPWSRLRRLALVLAAGSFLLPFALGQVLELALKSVNPDDVDVTADLAYLSQLLITGVVLWIAMLILTIAVIVRLRATEGREAARPAWIVLITQGVLVVVILVESVLIGAVEDAWRAAHGG